VKERVWPRRWAVWDRGFRPPKTVRRRRTRIPYLVYSAIGNVVIPVDDDPGWSTFRAGHHRIRDGCVVRQVLLNGNPLAFGGFLATMSILNDVPKLVEYGPEFLQMSPAAQDKYFGDILTGQFENDGFGDPLGFASGLSLISTKATFFLELSESPGCGRRGVSGPDEEQRETGWDHYGLRGPVGPQEEAQLRAKYFDAEELPGVDPTNYLDLNMALCKTLFLSVAILAFTLEAHAQFGARKGRSSDLCAYQQGPQNFTIVPPTFVNGLSRRRARATR